MFIIITTMAAPVEEHAKYPHSPYLFVSPKTGEVLFDTDHMLMPDDAKVLEEHGIEEVKIRSVMTCEARRLLFDYYRKKPRKSCPVRLPRFFFKMAEICVTPTKPLPCRAFRLDGLITPTTISYPTELNGAVSKCKS